MNTMHVVEKCAHCWHFIEPNDTTGRELFEFSFKLAEYVHLDNGEKEHDHDAEPSGDKRTLDEWKRDQPALFHAYPDGKIGPNSALFIPEFATAWDCADDCDTCWYLLSVGPDSAEAEFGEDGARARLRKHIASRHMLTSEDMGVVCVHCGSVCTVDDHGTLIDQTGGDVCTEHGDDLPHEERNMS